MWRLALVVLALAACDRRAARAPSRDAVATAIRARGPVPVSTSPDGTRVLVEDLRAGGVHLDVIARRTGAAIARRDDDEPAIGPVWRGDGGAIAYFVARSHRRTYDLRIWDFAGGDRSLGAPVTATAFARFAPDGAQIAYLATDARQQRVLTVARVADASHGRALLRVAEHAEAEWSPDGRRIATATAAAPGTLTVVDAGGAGELAIPVVDGELRDLAWSADGSVVAVTGRATGATWLQVFRVRLADQRVDALPPSGGDCHAPRFVGDELAYHVERDGERRIYVAGRGGTRAIGRSDASARLLGVDREHAIVAYRDRTSPAYLDELALQAAAVGPVPPPRGAPATSIEIVAPDGVRLPAYLWRARAAVGAVVIVHGGPALHASPAWNEKTQLLVDAGLDVVKLDYRGSTGHGAAFEALGAPAPLRGRIADVAVARDDAVRRLGLPPERVIVLGESYGAGLVAAAAASQSAASPIVLVATQPLPIATVRAARCPVIAFHGADDDISPAPAARAHLDRAFADRLRWHLVAGEGHNLARTASWAAVYAAILELRDRRCR